MANASHGKAPKCVHCFLVPIRSVGGKGHYASMDPLKFLDERETNKSSWQRYLICSVRTWSYQYGTADGEEFLIIPYIHSSTTTIIFMVAFHFVCAVLVAFCQLFRCLGAASSVLCLNHANPFWKRMKSNESRKYLVTNVIRMNQSIINHSSPSSSFSNVKWWEKVVVA